MTELTNEQKVRIFAMYLDQTVMFDNREGRIHTYYLPAGKFEVGKMWYVSLESTEDAELSCSVAASDCKLLLTPLSAISDEHAIETIILFHDGEISRSKAEKYIPYVKEGGTYDKNVECWNYLVQQGYAVPLFIEAGHPDNGKTAIELGLTIDKTTLK